MFIHSFYGKKYNDNIIIKNQVSIVRPCTFSIVSLSPYLISPSHFLTPFSFTYFNLFSIFSLSLFPRCLLHPFPLPHLLLSSIPHNFASYLFPLSPPFSHRVFFFSFIWYNNITMYMITLLENIHAYLGISVYLDMYISAYFIYVSVFWCFSVHSSINRIQSGVVFDSFRYLG